MNSINLSRGSVPLKYRRQRLQRGPRARAAAGPAVTGISFPPWGLRAPINALSSPAIELTATRHRLWNLLNYDNALSGGLARRADGKVPAAVNSAVTARSSDGHARTVPAVKWREKRHLSELGTHGTSLGWLTAGVRATPGSSDL